MKIYLDYQATTPCDERVLEKMLPFFTKKFGNPHSDHLFGTEASEALEEARTQVADIIGATSKEIIFTSGATEANNLAIKGVTGFYKQKTQIITSTIEHKCVLNTCKRLETLNFKTIYLPTDKKGFVQLDILKQNLSANTGIVSIIFANNEIGTIQHIDTIGKICKQHGAIFHTDAAQSVGKLEIDVKKMNIDLLSLSSHKIYGPKGIGALYKRSSGNSRINLLPIFDGGGQERGIRSGTVPVSLCVGFGEACRIAKSEMIKNNEHISKLQNIFLQKIMTNIENVFINGDMTQRVPGNLNLSFKGVESEALIFGLKTIAISSGSACSSDKLESSYVLKALGLPDDLINCSVRISIGKSTTLEEINYTAEAIISTVSRLRKISTVS